MNLTLAPLQGFTDATFRKVWQKHFTGISAYYAPYIALQNDGTIKKSQWRDILPERNDILPIPQLLPSSADEALLLMEHLNGLGVYKEVNVNMGCPYPMVTNRGRGSGLLPHPQRIKEVLDALFNSYGADLSFSVKLRCGWTDFDEMGAVFDVLNDFDLQSIILHPRIATQLYKGQASRSHFAKAKTMTDRPLIYNGDINTLEDYHMLVDEFPDLDGVMLGRGVLQNPLLPQEIRQGEVCSLQERLPLFLDFVNELIEVNRENLSGDSHLLSKLKSYLPYFLAYNPTNKKAYKTMKKANGMKPFESGMWSFLGSC